MEVAERRWSQTGFVDLGGRVLRDSVAELKERDHRSGADALRMPFDLSQLGSSDTDHGRMLRVCHGGAHMVRHVFCVLCPFGHK
jgi:hypothetical protein